MGHKDAETFGCKYCAERFFSMKEAEEHVSRSHRMIASYELYHDDYRRFDDYKVLASQKMDRPVVLTAGDSVSFETTLTVSETGTVDTIMVGTSGTAPSYPSTWNGPVDSSGAVWVAPGTRYPSAPAPAAVPIQYCASCGADVASDNWFTHQQYHQGVHELQKQVATLKSVLEQLASIEGLRLADLIGHEPISELGPKP